MINLSNRSYTKELLDGDDIPFADIRQNMQELNTINKYLGGHTITTHAVKAMTAGRQSSKPLSICEIGCGGGDNLQAIALYCKQKNIPVHFTGIDIKEDCIAFARQQYPGLQARWITSDYRLVNFGTEKPDIIFSSLFCHHFTEAELVPMLQWMQQNTTQGFFINDLHRHPFAYYSIRLITALFSRSYLVKNDGPLSVARGFTTKEWQHIFAAAGITGVSIQWKWAFRHLIMYNHD